MSCPNEKISFYLELKRFHFVEAFTTLCKLAQQDTTTFVFRPIPENIFVFVEDVNSRTKTNEVLSNYQNDYIERFRGLS